MGDVNVAPWAAKVVSERPECCELWWEDPRDITRVEVTFAEPVSIECLPRLEYWRDNWPQVHVAANAVVGSGREGWLPLDDWVAGCWQAAATAVSGDGRRWTFALRPLADDDLPAAVIDSGDGAGAAALADVRFRRTLKVRLCGPGMPAVETLAAHTDSEWRDVDVCFEWGGLAGQNPCWDGRLEAYNGEVLAVAPLRGAVEMLPDGGWTSSLGASSAGVRARVRYAWNADRNSSDRTIVTFRAREQMAFSVDVNGLVEGEVVFIPCLGVAVGEATAYEGLAAIRDRQMASLAKTTRQKTEALPEQTWERVRGEMPAKASRLYFVLGTEGGRQKARLHPSGEIDLAENYIRRVPGRDSHRLLWQGPDLHIGFGLPASEPSVRELAEGYLPILRTAWATAPIAYEQEAFATWLEHDISDDGDKQGDDTVVVLARLTLANVGSAAAVASLTLSTRDDAAPDGESLAVDGDMVYASVDGQRRLRLSVDSRGRGDLRAAANGAVYGVELAPGEAHSIVAKVPLITADRDDEVTALRALSFDEQRAKVAGFWRARVAEGMQISVPNDDLNRFHRAHLTHMLIVNDREPGSERRAPRCGGFHYGNFPDEGVMCTTDLDRRGYTREAEQCLEIMAHYQGTVPLPGEFETQDGVLYGSGGYEAGGYNRGQGWAMYGFAEHYRFTRDRAWLERVAPVLVKACDWVTRERLGAGPSGFLPAGSLEDVHDYWHWLSSNAYACWGFRAIAWALSEVGHPEARRLREEGEAFADDLMAGFNESRARAPVARLADGSWVPYYPARLERRGRDFGWLREVLEGSMGLLVAGLIPVSDPAADWILDDYEDNLYLSRRYGYPGTMADFGSERWFDWGGFSMQSNLLLHPAIYLRRDEVKPFLRTFFNGFCSTYHADTVMCSEHDLPTLAEWAGDHFKTSDEANVAHYLRLMLIEEQGDDLILGKAIPREWLEQGKVVSVERALTYFGEMGYEVRSHVDEGYVEVDVDLPGRNPPRRATLRLRHPRQAPIAAVAIGGVAWDRYDAPGETVALPLDRGGRLRLRIEYR